MKKINKNNTQKTVILIYSVMLPDNLLFSLEQSGNSVNLQPDMELLTQITHLYEREGYFIGDILCSFLAHFADKELFFMNEFSNQDNVHFKIKRAIRHTPKYLSDIYKRDFKMKVVIPIGLAFRENMVLFANEDNLVYAYTDNLLILMGLTPFDALANILLNKELKRIEFFDN